MRLIDADEIRKSIRESLDECVEWADEVEESEMYARVSQSIGTFVECSLRIKNAPTVDAVPMSVLDDIKAEITEYMNDCATTSEYTRLGFQTSLNVIDKHIGERSE